MKLANDIATGTGPDPRSAPRQDQFEINSQGRIAAWGRLEADDYYFPLDSSEWRKRYPRLTIGPDKTGQILRHVANMSHSEGRRLTKDELTHTFEKQYGPLRESLINEVLNYFDHEDARRAAREWVGRRRGKRLASWMEREADEGHPVPIVREEPSLFNRLNGHRIAATGNEEIDHIVGADDEEDDARYARMNSRDRRRAEQRHARRAMITVEVKHEVSEKKNLETRMVSIEGRMEEMAKRLESSSKRGKDAA